MEVNISLVRSMVYILGVLKVFLYVGVLIIRAGFEEVRPALKQRLNRFNRVLGCTMSYLYGVP